MKEQDSLIRKAVARAKNKDVDEVSFLDITKKKSRGKKKQKNNPESFDEKDIFSKDESIQLTGQNGTHYVTYDGISKGRKIFKGPSDKLLDWTDTSFYMYTQSLYQKKFQEKQEWTLNRGGSIIEIQKIRDELSALFGGQSNIVLKDYVDYCFKNYVKKLMRANENGKFFFGQLRLRHVLEAFYNHYGPILKRQREKDFVVDMFRSTLSAEAIERSYLLNTEGFVCDFGIVIALNWLVENKKINRGTAGKEIYDACYRIERAGFFNVVKESTEKWSPYPDWFIMDCNKLDLFIKKINPMLDINVGFEGSSKVSKKFKFIRRAK
jgi:hypothetical protein